MYLPTPQNQITITKTGDLLRIRIQSKNNWFAFALLALMWSLPTMFIAGLIIGLPAYMMGDFYSLITEGFSGYDNLTTVLTIPIAWVAMIGAGFGLWI